MAALATAPTRLERLEADEAAARGAWLDAQAHAAALRAERQGCTDLIRPQRADSGQTPDRVSILKARLRLTELDLEILRADAALETAEQAWRPIQTALQAEIQAAADAELRPALGRFVQSLEQTANEGEAVTAIVEKWQNRGARFPGGVMFMGTPTPASVAYFAESQRREGRL